MTPRDRAMTAPPGTVVGQVCTKVAGPDRIDRWFVSKAVTTMRPREVIVTLFDLDNPTSQQKSESWDISDFMLAFKVVDFIPQAERPPADAVNHPKHYTQHPSGVECVDITEHMTFCLGNAIKYIWRAGLKSPNPIEDLKKARWYLDREIQRLEKTCV